VSALRRRLAENPRAIWAYERAHKLENRITAPLRRRYYLEGRSGELVERLPGALRRRLGLDDPSAVGSRRVEVGGGPYAQRGHIHVDIDAYAAHLEVVAPAGELPFPAGWAQEVLAIHSLEHVHPRDLADVLEEWHRVLAPGGRVRIHVPNGPELFAAYLEAPVQGKWRMMAAILGMFCGPGVTDPRALRYNADHQLIFDAPLLRSVLEEAGFTNVTDLTEQVVDRHTDGWREIVPHFSLVAEATKPAN